MEKDRIANNIYIHYDIIRITFPFLFSIFRPLTTKLNNGNTIMKEKAKNNTQIYHSLMRMVNQSSQIIFYFCFLSLNKMSAYI
jgi:hypothetical protein